VENQRIIFAVTNDLTYDQRMIRICTSLCEAGYEVLLVGRSKLNSIPLRHQVFEQKRLKCLFQKGKLFYLEFNIKLFWYLLFKKTDAFAAIDLDTLVACTLASKIRSKKLVFDAHEYFEEVPEVTGRPLIKKIWQLVANLCIPKAHLAYTVNRALAQLFSEKYRIPFHTIRNVPYPYGIISRNPKQEKPIILYQGALNKGRGLEYLIQAMPRIDAICLIAGEGDLSGQLRTMVNDYGVKNKVTFLGYIEPDELKKITTQATIGYNVMENIGLSYYYSLANKFFDYIQAEIPQICAPFPEYTHINEKFNVALLCNCTSQEIISTINTLLTNEELYNNLRQQCKIAKKSFNWEDEDEKLKSMFRNVI
jgi:glycosyltransferase involved in cell wall biosynthesis